MEAYHFLRSVGTKKVKCDSIQGTQIMLYSNNTTEGNFKITDSKTGKFTL